MKWYLKVLRQCADFNSRAGRREYWMFVLLNILFSWAYTLVVMLVLLLAFNILDVHMREESVSLLVIKLSLIYYAIVFIPAFAVTVRRLHDIGKSGWNILLNLIPFVGPIWLLVLLATPGEEKENRFGANPDEVQGASGSDKARPMDKALICLMMGATFLLLLQMVNQFTLITKGAHIHTPLVQYWLQATLSLFLNIGFIIFGLSMLQPKPKEKTASVLFMLVFAGLLLEQLYYLFFVGFSYVPIVWIIPFLAMMTYGYMLFRGEGKKQMACYALIAGSAGWALIILAQMIVYVRHFMAADWLFNPDVVFNLFGLILPVSLLIYGITNLKEKTIGYE